MGRRGPKAEESKPLPSEAPLSRLHAHGPGVLSDAELLALILDADFESAALRTAAKLVQEHGLSRLLQGGLASCAATISPVLHRSS